ncbi:MAG: hypothetical protein WCY05_04150 [Candidatus Omnitrophota bacterium]
MSKYTYKKKYTSETAYQIIQLRSDRNRQVDEYHADYLLFLQEGNTPELIPYVAPIEPTLEDLKSSKISMLKMNAQMFIEKQYPQFKQRSAALGVYDETYKNEIVNFIKAKKTIVDALELQIQQAATKEELDAININIEL